MLKNQNEINLFVNKALSQESVKIPQKWQQTPIVRQAVSSRMLSNYHPHHESYGSSMVQSLILENDKLLDLQIEKYVLL